MKIVLWPEEDNSKELWYLFAICDMDGVPTGSIYRSSDYKFSLCHAEQYGSGLGLRVEDKVCQLTQSK